MAPTVAELDAANRRLRESAQAVGVALSSVTVYTEPAVARAVQAEQNLYTRIDAEFGMLSSTEAGKRMGSPGPITASGFLRNRLSGRGSRWACSQ